MALLYSAPRWNQDGNMLILRLNKVNVAQLIAVTRETVRMLFSHLVDLAQSDRRVLADHLRGGWRFLRCRGGCSGWNEYGGQEGDEYQSATEVKSVYQPGPVGNHTCDDG